MTHLDCIAETQYWLIVPALIGTVFLFYLIIKHNNLGVKDTFLALVGLKKTSRTVLINLVHAAALIVPLGLVMWQMGLCDPPLFGK